MENKYAVQAQAAKEIVLAAGKFIKKFRDENKFDFSYKDNNTPVTQADKMSEAMIRQKLIEQFPDYGFIGEEMPDYNPACDYIWICDPIDGTWSFINNENTVSVSLALQYKHETVVAVVYNPFTNEIFCAAKGEKNFYNKKKMPILQKENLAHSIVNFRISTKNENQISLLYRLWNEKKIGKIISQGGSLAYNLALVAQGSHSIFLRTSNRSAQTWDIAGGFFLVENSGGVVTDIYGEKIDIFQTNKTLLAASNKILHAQLLNLLKENNFANL